MTDTTAIVAALKAAFIAEYVEALTGSLQFAILPAGVPVPADLVTDDAVDTASSAWLAANVDTPLLVDPGANSVVGRATRTASAIYAAVIGSAQPAAADQLADWQRCTTDLATARLAYGPSGTDRPIATTPSGWAAGNGALTWTPFDAVQPPSADGTAALQIHLEHARVSITRAGADSSWWYQPFVAEPLWFVPGLAAGALLASPTASPGGVSGGVQIVPTALLLVRNLTMTGLPASDSVAPTPTGVLVVGVLGAAVAMIPPVGDPALPPTVPSTPAVPNTPVVPNKPSLPSTTSVAAARKPGDVGIDFSGARIDPGDARKNGAAFIIRYSAGAGNSVSATAWKLCRKGEVAAAIAHGVDFIANSEWRPNRVTEGAGAGRVDGAADLAFWKAHGLARGASIYCSWDAAPMASQFDAVAAYLTAYDKALGGYYHVDLYAGDAALNHMLDRKIIRYGWRPNAGSWSGDPHGHYYQPAKHGLPLADKMRTLTRAHLWQTGNYWYNKGADEDLILRAPVGSHLDALKAAAP